MIELIFTSNFGNGIPDEGSTCYCGCWCPAGAQPKDDDHDDDKNAEISGTT